MSIYLVVDYDILDVVSLHVAVDRDINGFKCSNFNTELQTKIFLTLWVSFYLWTMMFYDVLDLPLVVNQDGSDVQALIMDLDVSDVAGSCCDLDT